MLSLEDNELLTRVGPGTPMGSLLRRFWIPAVLSRELVADGDPVRLRILGEDLVAFRDSNGRVGIVEAYCSHKLAPLFFGRNEECGLRCVYHGWKFDVNGACLDMPNVDAEAADRMKRNVGITAYRAREAGQMIWIYMGLAEDQPEMPAFEWTGVPDGALYVSRWLQRTNYAQGLEGDLDTSHISFLHGIPETGRLSKLDPVIKGAVRNDGAPVLQTRDTPFGLTYGARRRAGADAYYWRITHWLLPFFTLIAGGAGSHSGRAWVPVDDEHLTTFDYEYRSDRAFTPEENDALQAGDHFPPLLEKTAVELPDGYVIDTYVPQANRGNDYEIDRTTQRTVNFTGIRGTNDQDRALQENMRSVPGSRSGRIVDRSREHLVSSDAAGIAARRKLLRLAKELMSGEASLQRLDSEAYRVRAFGRVTIIDSLEALLESERTLANVAAR